MHFIWTQELPSTQVWLADYIRINDLESTHLRADAGLRVQDSEILDSITNCYTGALAKVSDIESKKDVSPFSKAQYDNILDSIIVVATKNQTNGIGSRANTWDKVSCGLYLSCAVPIALLPQDLPRQSSSIYFGQILLELFREFHKDLWLKWPNDFYLQDDKVGGLITQYIKGFVIFGVGLNIFSEDRASLLQSIQKDSMESISTEILSQIIKKILHFLSFNIVELPLQKNIDTTLHGITCNAFLQNNMTWYEVFNRYKQNFSKNHRFYTHINEDGYTHKVSLQNALLQNDGSIVLHDKILYSLR